MEKKKLSEVIDYKKHIAPYRIIDIVSGVSSGKNYWVENILMNQKRVLLITSRKSKVNETIERTGLDNSLSFIARDMYCKDSFILDNPLLGSCVYNSWQIEYYMKHLYNPTKYPKSLWDYFDIIVVDEAHSLATDATYCDAPFYLLDFIKAAYKTRKVKIILMTATHNPIKGLINPTNKEHYAFWDFTDQCTNILPKNVFLYSKEKILSNICNSYKLSPTLKRHIIYFTTRTKHITDYIVPYLTENGIPEENIAVSFSNIDAETKFSDTLLHNKARTEAYLSKHEDLPDDIKVFITTSRYKKGINIKNDDYFWDIVIESHWIDEIQQMWGRVRSKINSVSIVYDAQQHQSYSVEQDINYFMNRTLLKNINNAFNKWCSKNNYPLTNRYQDKKILPEIKKLQETSFIYIRYSTHDDKFHIYKGKILGIKSFHESVIYLKKYYDELLGNSYSNECTESPFPVPTYLILPPDKKNQFIEYINEKGYTSRPITKEERQDLLNFVNDTLKLRQKKNKFKPYTDVSKAIRQFGYELKECSKHKGSKLYGYYNLKKIEKATTEGDLDIAI